MQMEDRTKVKIAIIGDQRTGKTSLVHRFLHNTFKPFHTTAGLDINRKKLDINCHPVTLVLLETAGSKRFQLTLNPVLYRGANIVFVVFDVTSYSSYENVTKWLRIASQHLRDEPVFMYLVGNKCDLAHRVVSETEARMFAEKHQMTYVETSAQSGTNVQQLFVYSTQLYLSSHTVPVIAPVVLQPKASLLRKQPANCWA
jgi:small GTP-binding protein